MVKQTDMALLNIPFMSVAYAPAGTSLLKACIQEAGFTCIVKDYNIKLWHSLSDPKVIADLENYFTVNASLDTDTQILVDQYYDLVVEDLLKLNPKWIAKLNPKLLVLVLRVSHRSPFLLVCQVFT